MTPIATAATIVLLRPDPDGFRVFLVQRHRGSAFMPHMWVFPGGRVDPADAPPSPRVRGGRGLGRELGYPEDLHQAVLVAGVRETFEESGIWLGEGDLPEAMREPLAKSEVSLVDVLEQHDAAIDLDVVRPWARWVTPEGERRRFDTAFLVSVVGEVEGRHDAQETVDSGWFRPAEALEAGLDRIGLAPPTWWALTELAAFHTVEDVLAASRDLRPVCPVIDDEADAFAILLPGHRRHPEAPRADLPTRIGLADGGWRAE